MASSLAGSILAVILVSAIVIFGAYRQAEVNRARAVAEKVDADHQKVIAEESRAAEQQSRKLAQERETEANLNQCWRSERRPHDSHTTRSFSVPAFSRRPRCSTAQTTPEAPTQPRGADASPEEVGNEQIAGLQSLLFEVATESVARLERILAGHDDAVSRVAFPPSGDVLVSSSWDGNLRWWNPSEGSLVRTVRAHEGWGQGLAVGQDGTALQQGCQRERPKRRVCCGTCRQL